MKKTQFIELRRTIRSTLVSYVSIAVFVMLGISVFCGISWGGESIGKNVHRAVCSEGHMHDLSILYPYGLDDEDLERLRSADGVDEVEGSCYAYGFFRVNGRNDHAVIHQLPKSIDLVIRCEGQLPEKEDEIAVELSWARDHGVEIGDEICFLPTGGSSRRELAALIRCDTDSMRQESDSGLPPLKNDVFTVTALVSTTRYIDDAYGASTENDISLSTALYVADCAWDEECDIGCNEILIRSDALHSLYVYSEEYDEAVTDLKEDLAPVFRELTDARYSEILENAETLLSEAKAQLQPGVDPALLPEDLREEYESALLALEEQKTAIGELENIEANFVSANENASLQLYDVFRTSVSRMRYIMALLFVIVGLLICHSAVSRLVHDQIVRIGTKKALGLTTGEITRSYLFYALSAAVVGCILGLLVSYVVAYIILFILMGGSFPGGLRVYADLRIAAVVTALELVLILLTTVTACRSLLKRSAITLLAGPTPPAGKNRFYEKTRLWNKASLLTKTIVNNCLNDKRRVVDTLIGISSCTTLIIMSLTLYVNVLTGNSIQVNDHYHFDSIVYFDSSVENASEAIKEQLSALGFAGTEIRSCLMIVDTVEDDYVCATVFSPSDMEEFRRFYTLEPYTDSDLSPYEGAWLCSAYLNINGGSSRQTVTGVRTNGEEVALPLDGFFLSYASFDELVITSEKFETVFGTDPKPNAYVVNSGGNAAAVDKGLQETSGYLYTLDYKAKNAYGFELFAQLSLAVVGVSLALSVVMAFFVILNILTMYVEEKKRELIILRINGYTVKNARKYIYSDTILLTIIGILIAVALGTLVGNIAIGRMECSMLFLLKRLNLFACIMGAATTALLVWIICLIALKQIHTMQLTDINK